jgi:virulence-associated protein VapD
MLKIQVLMDDNKIVSEDKYDVSKVHRAVDSVFTEKYGLVKAQDGFYLERGNESDYANFWNAILLLKDQPWFLDNVKTWLWFNSDDSPDPADFVVEDLQKHYTSKQIAYT